MGAGAQKVSTLQRGGGGRERFYLRIEVVSARFLLVVLDSQLLSRFLRYMDI